VSESSNTRDECALIHARKSEIFFHPLNSIQLWVTRCTPPPPSLNSKALALFPSVNKIHHLWCFLTAGSMWLLLAMHVIWQLMSLYVTINTFWWFMEYVSEFQNYIPRVSLAPSSMTMSVFKCICIFLVKILAAPPDPTQTLSAVHTSSQPCKGHLSNSILSWEWAPVLHGHVS